MKIIPTAASSSLVLCAGLALGCVPSGTLDPSTGSTSHGSSSSAGEESGHGGMAGAGTTGGGGTTASRSSGSGQGGADTCTPTKKPAQLPIALFAPAGTAGQDGRIYMTMRRGAQ